MGGNDAAYNAAKVIVQACEDMVREYEALATSGAGILSSITGSIGLYYQYKWTVDYPPDYGPQVIEYHDADVSWWERGLIGIGKGSVTTERIPHPRRQEALDRLAQTQGSIEGVDTKFDYDARDIRDTVSSVGKFMASWVDAATGLSAIPFPEDPRDVPTTGDPTGWRSPYAFQSYERIVGLQFQAHTTTETVITNTLKNSAEFLTGMASHLANFAQLVRDQETYYAGLATSKWIPGEKTIAWIIDTIGAIATKVIEFQTQQDKLAAAMINVLNDAVASVLKIEELRLQLNGMSRSGDPGWPMPTALGGEKQAGSSPISELRFQTTYFKDHIDAWQKISDKVGPVVTTAEATPTIARMFYRWPAFAAATASALNQLSTEITDKALKRGKQATGQISQNLAATIREYLKTEDLNTQEAKQLEEILNG